VQAVTPERVQAFQPRFISAAYAGVRCRRDMDVDGVVQALTAAFAIGRSLRRCPALPAGAAAAATATGRALRAAHARQANAHLRAVLPLALTDLHPDYPALSMANHLLGAAATRAVAAHPQRDGLSYDVARASSGTRSSRIRRLGGLSLRSSHAEPGQGRERTARGTRARAEGRLHAGRNSTVHASDSEYRRLSATCPRTRASRPALARQPAVESAGFALSQQVDDAIAPADASSSLGTRRCRKYMDPAHWRSPGAVTSGPLNVGPRAALSAAPEGGQAAGAPARQ